ncbi:hypothetical protein TeGR_g9072 [Tetraparma gracilis]|uniref:CHCH domain-containing protein n=1 Tax=Tetraparma gracilis TaxID=2962635 RepID=A0ABQ6MC51_9STRA|nr:hypothetical protein TeGR_g9072 [Tetraparma gracilis]
MPSSHPHAQKAAAAFETCSAQRAASLKCVEDNYGDPRSSDLCRQFFDAYKKCTGEERLERLRRNREGH